MKRLWSPPPLFGVSFLSIEPSIVEVLELDYEKGEARILSPVAESSIINILRKKDGRSLLKTIEKLVPLSELSFPPSESVEETIL